MSVNAWFRQLSISSLKVFASYTTDTLSSAAVTDPNTAARRVISVSIVPKTDDDRQSLQRALSDLAQRDPTIRVTTDSTDDQTIVSGTGELQLEMICDRPCA